jgi:hypothetical protein
MHDFCKFTFFAGEVQVWIDGVSVINVCGLNLRMSNEGRIKGMHLSTFFGGEFWRGYLCKFQIIDIVIGHEDDWASPKEQKAWFADITGAILA